MGLEKEFAEWNPDTFHVGIKKSFKVEISSGMIDRFSAFSNDWNPLHNDEDFAANCGYKSVVAHGAIQQALISRMIGMYLPGRLSIIKKITTQYSSPVISGSTVDVHGEVIKWLNSDRSGIVLVRIYNPSKELASISEVEIGMTNWDGASKLLAADDYLQNDKTNALNNKLSETNLPRILVIGGSSILSQKVFDDKKWVKYQIIRLARSSKCDICGDFENWSDVQWKSVLTEVEPYAVVLFASYPPVKKPIDKLDFDLCLKNVKLHTQPVQYVAEMVKEKKISNIKRIVCLSSFGARHLAAEKGYETYSYAKMIVSHYCKDIAVDLAEDEVTVNIISPAEIPLGMNAGLSEKTLYMLKAKSPNRRLVDPKDVESCLKYLIDEESNHVSGQEIIIAGGRS